MFDSGLTCLKFVVGVSKEHNTKSTKKRLLTLRARIVMMQIKECGGFPPRMSPTVGKVSIYFSSQKVKSPFVACNMSISRFLGCRVDCAHQN